MDAFAEVKSRLSMREVLQHYGFEVTRAGYALCPFHPDHHPSMKVYEKSFYCFSCGTGGDLINFVAKLNGIRNIDACKELAQAFGIEIEASSSGGGSDFRSKYMMEKRERERREREQVEIACRHAEDVLAAMMRYLTQGKYKEGCPEEQRMRSLAMLPECEYWCQCIDEDKQEFLAKNREVIRNYEADLDRWNIEV